MQILYNTTQTLYNTLQTLYKERFALLPVTAKHYTILTR